VVPAAWPLWHHHMGDPWVGRLLGQGTTQIGQPSAHHLGPPRTKGQPGGRHKHHHARKGPRRRLAWALQLAVAC
jgi:hypothetical protein